MKKSNHSYSTVYSLILAMIFISSVAFSSCSGGGTEPVVGSDPSISSISPTKGAIGTDVIIKGQNFSTVKSENSVKFGSAEAAIISASESKLNVTVPAGISAGTAYTVTETVGGKTATASIKFAVSPPPDSADAVPQDGILETVTWNLLFYGYTNQGPSDEDQQTNNDIKIADSLNADLFALEEIKSDEAIQNLTSRMKGYKAIFDKTTNQGNAFVYNTNAIDPISSGKISMGQMSHAWAGRLPFYFSFNYKPGNGVAPIEIYAVVIHAKAGGDEDAYNRRKTAAQELYDYLTNQKPDAKIILLGDYNDETNTSIYTGHDSPYKPFVQDSDHYNVLTYSLSIAGKTSETGYNSVIDNILISNEMVEYYEEGSVKVFIPTDNFINNYGSTTSDHYPVWAKFDMTR